MKRTRVRIGLLVMFMVTALNVISAKQMLVEKVSDPASDVVVVTPSEDRDYIFWI